jgi:hypothetical protein
MRALSGEAAAARERLLAVVFGRGVLKPQTESDASNIVKYQGVGVSKVRFDGLVSHHRLTPPRSVGLKS